MNATPRATLADSKCANAGVALEDASIDEGVAYLMETYDLHEDEAREKVLTAKRRKMPGGRAVDE